MLLKYAIHYTINYVLIISARAAVPFIDSCGSDDFGVHLIKFVFHHMKGDTYLINYDSTFDMMTVNHVHDI